ncbi:MAG: iron transporter [Halobacteriaceae archaeon]
MRRRRFLALAGAGAAGAGGAGSLAGCLGLFETRSFSAPPVVEDRPDAVYYPTHVEQMATSGIRTENGYACALTYTYPHRFWLVSGTHRNRVKIEPDDAMHVMPVVWHAETGQVLPDVSPHLGVSRDGESVRSVSPWPMLSQPMGFHFGDNVRLPGDGTYDVSVHVGAPSGRRIGALADAPGDVTFEFTLDYSRSKLESIPWRNLPDEAGSRGAVPHAEMPKLPPSTVPEPTALPGRVLGSGTSGDAEFVVSVLEDATRFGGAESDSYLVVSPRSPYDRYLLPMMTLSASVRGSTRDLTATLAPDVGFHYGAALDGPPSEVTVHVDTPPQFARHEGYETAFVQMPDVTVST